MLLGILQFTDGVTGSRDVSLVAYGWFRVGIINMDTSQAVFLFQVEVPVNSDLVTIVVTQQRQQSLREHRGGTRFVEMQILQPFLKEVGQYLVFFNEEGGFGHYDELHF